MPAERRHDVHPIAAGRSAERSSERRDYYVPSKAIAARPEAEIPRYVKTVDQYRFPGTEDLKWLEFGAQHRTRFELRNNEYRENLKSGDRFLMRSRGYLGMREILDPFRFGLEFQDARQMDNDFAQTNRDVDENDILQAFGELYFEDVFGKGRPLRFQFGRMTLDYGDRRLVHRQVWSNAVNAFDGFRLSLGERSSDFQFDFFAVKPVDRLLRQPDRSNSWQWLYGFVGEWRRWSKYITLEPYYFLLNEQPHVQLSRTSVAIKPGGKASVTTQPSQTVGDHQLHTMGLHAWGMAARTGLDYDVNLAWQFGHDGEISDRAFAEGVEIGYTLDMPWYPRAAAIINYASGDRNPDDRINNSFDPRFGTSHAFSMEDLFQWRNMINPALRVSLDPTEKVHWEGTYRGHWLASDKDAWYPVGRRDATGRSGNFVGQELDTYVHWKVLKQFDLEVGYSHFIPGSFVSRTGPAPDSDFFYVEMTVQLDR